MEIQDLKPGFSFHFFSLPLSISPPFPSNSHSLLPAAVLLRPPFFSGNLRPFVLFRHFAGRRFCERSNGVCSSMLLSRSPFGIGFDADRALPAISQSQACDSDDLSALLGFSAGLKAPIEGWGSSNSSSSDCCRWPGVYCDPPPVFTGRRRVIGVDLSANRLQGSLSENLTGLDHLRHLNLSSNVLRGSVPPALFLLPRLELLDLSMNGLSGSFPPDINLPAIKIFNVSNNLFNGTLPIFTSSPNLTALDVRNNNLSGSITADFCHSSPQIQSLSFSVNFFAGNLPAGFGNCRSLVQLSAHTNEISGVLPEDLFTLQSLKYLHLQQNGLSGSLSESIGNLSNLLQLDISVNNFFGVLPNVFDRMSNLESFCAQNNEFNGTLPGSFSNLTNIRVLNLRNNSLNGKIDLNCSSMAMLSTLDLGSNHFTGFIPSSLSQCSKLNSLNLASNHLVGEIPTSFRIFSSLLYLSLSKNRFTNVLSALDTLQHCSNLTVLVLTSNFGGGETMPVGGISGFKKMEVFVLANCHLSGYIPAWLAGSTNLRVLDMSWNQLGGSIPTWLGSFDSLFYLDLSNNSLTGEIPESFVQLKGMIYANASAGGSSAQDFPFFMKKNASAKALQYNTVGSFPPSLILSNNRLVGSIPPGFGNLKMLLALDLHKNDLSGTIPEEISGMANLESLDLSYNNLTGNIPAELSKLNFLSSFHVSYNNLVGPIPSGGQFSTFSHSDFVGNKNLCGFHLSSCESEAPSSPESRKKKNKASILGAAVGIGVGTTFLLIIVYMAASRFMSTKQEENAKVVADTDDLESAGSRLVSLFHNKDSKEISINALLKSANNFDPALIIGCGGFGLVYKATLEDGKKVAIKRLSGDFCQMEREFHAEVEALSRAHHENLVLLQGYCKVGKDRLLVYSFMENGSLDYWLHERTDGPSILNWMRRVKIAQGAARGLAYLHQSCQPNIIHRDIKSSNILLDEHFEAHLADFGLARLTRPYDSHVTTDLVGTLGYIPPEYSQASLATFKGDIYSFGVVLLELLTCRRPVDISKPKGSRELVLWVLQMKKERREAEVLDPCIYQKELERQLCSALEIACLCVSESPKSRPSTQQLVAWLENIGSEGYSDRRAFLLTERPIFAAAVSHCPAPTIWQLLRELGPEYKLPFAGHSLGSCVAMLATVIVVNGMHQFGGMARNQIPCYAVAPGRCM
ncbi:Phytosulfokine receptor 1 [Platanthera guangdongensis]|uniref:Phytosulfokine receptor 1 n=1 Tax=Platanthera guangdongensis TaxID=2320717 RepID=A0ABR2N147_9ASPA